MPKTQNKQVGKTGEDLAVELLKDKGFQILERNWSNKWGEIDIIAKDKDVIVFVEVKTKIGNFYGSPEQMINAKKLEKIQKLASLYHPAVNSSKRIDVIAVLLSSDLNPEKINHYQAVY